ncbi:hypothetical protein D3C78_1680550 [compost metagenome]
MKGLVRRRAAELKLFNTKCEEDVDDMAMDKAKVIVYGKKIEDGLILEGRVYVPLRETAEALGAKANWDNKTKTATVMKI